MDIIVEYKFYFPDRNEISHIIDKTLKEYAEKYEESPWYIELKCNTQFFDKIKTETKNVSTKRNPRKTIIASNGRYEYRQINNFMISIKGENRKNFISTYMKCYKLPMLWRKFFLNIANNREYIINHCNGPLHKFDRLLRERNFNENPNDKEMRVFDDNLNNYYIVFG